MDDIRALIDDAESTLMIGDGGHLESDAIRTLATAMRLIVDRLESIDDIAEPETLKQWLNRQ